jgi:hypothetical protein
MAYNEPIRCGPCEDRFSELLGDLRHCIETQWRVPTTWIGHDADEVRAHWKAKRDYEHKYLYGIRIKVLCDAILAVCPATLPSPLLEGLQDVLKQLQAKPANLYEAGVVYKRLHAYDQDTRFARTPPPETKWDMLRGSLMPEIERFGNASHVERWDISAVCTVMLRCLPEKPPEGLVETLRDVEEMPRENNVAKLYEFLYADYVQRMASRPSMEERLRALYGPPLKRATADQPVPSSSLFTEKPLPGDMD